MEKNSSKTLKQGNSASKATAEEELDKAIEAIEDIIEEEKKAEEPSSSTGQ